MELDTVVVGDCLDVMGDMPDKGIDTIITDPPWGIKFMGKDWDHGVPGPRYWREALRVAKPGAFLLAFGGTRTWHRLACAIEDAGWEMRDTVMWVYAQGFPKSHDISKAIDKVNGAKRKVIRAGPFASRRPRADHSKQGLTYADDNYVRPAGHAITAPATEAARAWDGWGTGLKPAWEPIIVAMKPVDSTFAHNALAWGVAGLWIDGGRIGTEQIKTHNTAFLRFQGQNTRPWQDGHETFDTEHQGRWPSNFLLTHAPGCRRRGTRRVRGSHSTGLKDAPKQVGGGGPFGGGLTGPTDHTDPDGLETVDNWECVEGCAVKALGEQTKGTRASKPSGTGRKPGVGPNSWFATGEKQRVCHDDHGTAARFFYQSKASGRERNLGCQDVYWRKDKDAPIGFVRIDRDEWKALPEKQRARGNIHPTVKPLGVVEYLCRLTRTPTGGVVFDPFLGTGTTALGAIRTGRRWLGCDNEPDYVYLANLRIEALRRETFQMELSL